MPLDSFIRPYNQWLHGASYDELLALLPPSAKVEATPSGLSIEREDGFTFYGTPREAIAGFLELY